MMNNAYVINDVSNWSEFGDIYIVVAPSEQEALEVLAKSDRISKWNPNTYSIENAYIEKIDLNSEPKVFTTLVT